MIRMVALPNKVVAKSFNALRQAWWLVALLVALPLAPPVGLAVAEETTAVPRSAAEVHLSFAPVVKRVAPAVVNIYARKLVKRRQSLLFDDPFFKRFFGDEFPFGTPRERIENSLGSGVIVAPEGLIVTNNHVVENAEEVIVALPDRREFAATIVVADPRTDLAVLRLERQDLALPYLELMDSDDLEVGDLVLAIGNPFGVGQTVTSGIVSALARTQIGGTDFRSYIQTDASINPGNSGGALVTLDGKLAGINTAIYSKSGGSIGIGFATPSNLVRVVIASAASGRFVRPWLGASGQIVTADMAEGLGLDRPGGVLINAVYAGGPADRAGLQVGDVVLAVNGREVVDPESMQFRIATEMLGSTTTLTTIRDGEKLVQAVAVEAPPEDPPRRVTTLQGQQPLAGAVVANLSPALADELGLDLTAPGVIVLNTLGNSPARRLRLRRGDIMLRVNGRKIDLVSDLIAAVQAPRDSWAISLRRGDHTLKVVIDG